MKEFVDKNVVDRFKEVSMKRSCLPGKSHIY